jgi:hypothetical protein
MAVLGAGLLALLIYIWPWAVLIFLVLLAVVTLTAEVLERTGDL